MKRKKNNTDLSSSAGFKKTDATSKISSKTTSLRAHMVLLDNRQRALARFSSTGAHPVGAAIMAAKTNITGIQFYDLPCVRANILKQEALARGADLCVSADSIRMTARKTDAILFGTKKQLESLLEKLKIQPLQFQENVEDIQELLHNLSIIDENKLPPFSYGNGSISLSGRTGIMGILNITPDSFSDGGRFINHRKEIDIEAAVQKGLEMERDGADIIDIGGESSRPGASEVSEKEELRRIIPVIEALAPKLKIPVSVDTRRAKVASLALKKGARIINDITALGDPEMAETVRKNEAGLILMHMKGTPGTMQNSPSYRSLIGEIIGYLRASVQNALSSGIKRESILIDPGFGFGKTFEHNLELLSRLGEFKSLGLGILVGLSRKSFIGHITGKPVGERLTGSLAAAALAVLGGANIVRVHDVKEHREFFSVMDAIRSGGILP